MSYKDIEYDWFGFKMVLTGRERKNAKKREHYANNKEQISAQHKSYYQANKEQILAQKKEYRENNQEQISAYQKAYREAHREQTSAGKKSITVSRWRKQDCVIPPAGYTLCELYDEIYLPCNNCMVCNKDISMGGGYKCMDHCHETGEYRQILCKQCNTYDTWKNHSEWV